MLIIINNVNEPVVKDFLSETEIVYNLSKLFVYLHHFLNINFIRHIFVGKKYVLKSVLSISTVIRKLYKLFYYLIITLVSLGIL